jgi:hypothetical protein
VSLERRIASDRLTTPQAHLAVLVEPEADALDALVDADCAGALRSVPLLDTCVGELRERLRRRFELAGPVILTGHQAEFGHAGVFAKTIAVDALVRKYRGTGVFLTVDSDLPKARRLAVPHAEQGEVQRAFVTIPGCDPRLPMEWQPPASVAQWHDFFERVAELAGDGDTLLRTYSGGVLGGESDAINACHAIERGHAAVDRSLGFDTVVIARVSRVSRTPEFRAFVGHLALNASVFAQAYNEAQRAYRVRHQERSPQRPAPALAVGPDRVELPLWVCQAGQPRRRLFAAARGDAVELLADDEPIGRESRSRLGAVSGHDEPWQIERSGWHLRPRALTLSAFMRLFLSDLFVHGIGGAKYDEMTEDFARRFFEAELPPACCVSATLHLPLPRYGVDAEMLAAARHARRDLRFNPQRHLPNLPPDLRQQRAALIGKSNALRRERPSDQAARRHVFNEIRAINCQLLCDDPKRAAALEQEWRLLERRWRSDGVALDREHFFALHPRRTIEELVRRVRAALGVRA